MAGEAKSKPLNGTERRNGTPGRYDLTNPFFGANLPLILFGESFFCIIFAIRNITY